MFCLFLITFSSILITLLSRYFDNNIVYHCLLSIIVYLFRILKNLLYRLEIRCDNKELFFVCFDNIVVYFDNIVVYFYNIVVYFYNIIVYYCLLSINVYLFRILKNLLYRLEIRCDNEEYGCSTVVKLDVLPAHVKGMYFVHYMILNPLCFFCRKNVLIASFFCYFRITFNFINSFLLWGEIFKI